MQLSTCSFAPMGCWRLLNDEVDERDVETIQQC